MVEIPQNIFAIQRGLRTVQSHVQVHCNIGEIFSHEIFLLHGYSHSNLVFHNLGLYVF